MESLIIRDLNCKTICELTLWGRTNSLQLFIFHSFLLLDDFCLLLSQVFHSNYVSWSKTLLQSSRKLIPFHITRILKTLFLIIYQHTKISVGDEKHLLSFSRIFTYLQGELHGKNNQSVSESDPSLGSMYLLGGHLLSVMAPQFALHSLKLSRLPLLLNLWSDGTWSS